MMMERRERADCTVSALACVAAIEYERAHAIARSAGRRSGARFHAARAVGAAKRAGLRFEKLRFTRRRTLARFLREYPGGRYYVRKAGHVLAVIDGRPCDSTSLAARIIEGWRFIGPPLEPLS